MAYKMNAAGKERWICENPLCTNRLSCIDGQKTPYCQLSAPLIDARNGECQDKEYEFPHERNTEYMISKIVDAGSEIVMELLYGL